MKSSRVLVAMLLAPAVALAQGAAQRVSVSPGSYWGDGERGWFWYEDPALEPEEKLVPREAPRRVERSEEKEREAPRAPELIELERLRKQVEDYRNIAVVNPTEANVRRYMELEASVVRMASNFADVAQRIAWATPDLDQTLQGRPVNAKAIEVFDRETAQGRARTVSDLGKDHVLFFFFRSDCPYCHAYAPILEAFQARHGIEVVPVSVDGGGLPGFDSPRVDNGIARTLNVTQVPATFLAQPFTGQIVPIGFGVLSESQLLERISIVSGSGSDPAAQGAGTPISLQ